MSFLNTCAAYMLLVFVSVCAQPANSEPTHQLKLAEIAIPLDGVFVGELTFTDTGVDGLSAYMGNRDGLSFELIRPDGKFETLYQRAVGSGQSKPSSCLGPGDWIKQPVFLLRLSDEFIFNEIGTYRIRVNMNHLIPRSVNVVTQEKSPEPPRHFGTSNWVEFRVTPPGSGHENWRKWMDYSSDICRPFRPSRWAEDFYSGREDFGAYTREIEKYLVYQLYGGPIRSAIENPKYRDEKTVAQAQRVLDLARKRGVGVEMWEWIMSSLVPTENGTVTNVQCVCNGYLVN